jgi:methyltransferase (TIGR00027 family)
MLSNVLVLLFVLVGLIVVPMIIFVLKFFSKRNISVFATRNESRIFKHERPSFTAELVCIYRAIGTKINVIQDELAYEFLDNDARFLVNLWCFGYNLVGSRKFPMMQAPFLISRTYVIDEFILKAKNCDQVVILGAGLDARAYRMKLNNPKVKWFEVDAPATQKMKVQKVAEVQAKKPQVMKSTALKDGNVTFVSCNFAANEDFNEKLKEKGFNMENPNTVIVLEGVASYLTWEELKATLSKIALCAPGTLFVMNCRSEDNKSRNSMFSEFLKLHVGEEYKFALNPAESAADKFAPIGFKVLEDLTFREAVARTPGLGDNMVPSLGSFNGHVISMQVAK